MFRKDVHIDRADAGTRRIGKILQRRQPSGCWNQNLTGRGPREGLVLVFVSGKEKQLVLDDGSADFTAKPIPIVTGFGISRFRYGAREIVQRIGVTVLIVIPACTMELVASGFRCGDELSRRGMAIFRIELVCQQREFLHRIGNDWSQCSGGAGWRGTQPALR